MSLPAGVQVIEEGERSFFLLGTAHVSARSVEEVREAMDALAPDCVVIELCRSRHETLADPDRWARTDVFQVLRQGKGGLLLAGMLLSSFQRRLGSRLGVRPGAEMLEAAQLAAERGLRLELGDRDVQVTLKRTWAALGPWDRSRLAVNLLGAVLFPPQIKAEDVERMKQADTLDAMLEEVGQDFPSVRRTLIEERDRYLAGSIRAAEGKRVLAVVGAGHVPGIRRHWGEPADRAELERAAPPGPLFRAATWALPACLVLLLLWGLVQGGRAGWTMLWTWILCCGGGAALGALAALAQPLAILAAFLSAPITAIHPLLSSGMCSGLVEASLRRPRVADLEGVSADLTSVRGVYRNRFTRVLLVLVFTNLGTMLGSLLAVALGVMRSAG